jgi:hypothetical protein
MISIIRERTKSRTVILKFEVLTVICIITGSLIPSPISHSAENKCSKKADTSTYSVNSEKTLGNFSGGVFSFVQMNERYFLVTSGRNEGGELVLLDSTTGENSKINIDLPKFRDLFKIIKAPNFSMENPEIYFSALQWGDLTTPRIGRQALEQDMKDILPSGLVVYKAKVNLELKKLVNLQLIFKQNIFLVTGSNYGGALSLSNDYQYLFISVGDQGNYDTVQQINSGVGKILRLKLDGGIPKDNPFSISGESSKVYAYGLRNVYGILQLPAGKLLAIDHGPLGGDELNVVRKSGNYGWPISSEGVHYTGEFINSIVSKTLRPDLFWTDAVAPSAIAVVSKNKFSSLNGDILVSTLKGKSIFRIHEYCVSKFKIVGKFSFDFRVRDFSITQNGQLIVLSDANPAKLTVFTISH